MRFPTLPSSSRWFFCPRGAIGHCSFNIPSDVSADLDRIDTGPSFANQNAMKRVLIADDLVLASATLSVPGLCGKVVSPVGPRRGCQELEGQPDAGKDSLVRRAGRLQSLPSEPSQQRRKILAIVDQAHLAATILRRVT